MKIVVVIPTYNEAKNISRLLDALNEEFKSIPSHDCHVLVVEGNSPDGTADIVRECQKKYNFVHLLMEEKKAGLGAAYVFGFKYAMKELGAEVIIEMDADFQHDPKDLKKLITEIENGYDYAIASRFVKGGSIPKEWDLTRKLFSRVGNLISRIVLGIKGVHDFTTGFKASRVEGFVDKLCLDEILSKGFAYKIDLLYRMHKLGAKIKEVPIQFGLRYEGESKMARNNPMDSLRVVFTLRIKEKETQNFIRFCTVGLVGLFVDGGLFNILRLGTFSSMVSSLVSGFIAMTATLILNNYWTFKRKMQLTKNDVTSLLIIPAIYMILGPLLVSAFQIHFILAIVLGLASNLLMKKLYTKGNRVLEHGKYFHYFVVVPLYIYLYYASSITPILFRSILIQASIDILGDTFLVANLFLFIGIVIGLIWNFTIYSRIIWKEEK